MHRASSILPQFTGASAPWPLPVQLGLLGRVSVIICGGFYLGLGYAADRVLGSRPRVAQVTTTRIAGGAAIPVGMAVLAERPLERARVGQGDHVA